MMVPFRGYGNVKVYTLLYILVNEHYYDKWSVFHVSLLPIEVTTEQLLQS